MVQTELAVLLCKYPKVLELAKKVFTNDEAAIRWLNSPRKQLLGLTPLEVIEEDESKVEDLLFRILTGDFS